MDAPALASPAAGLDGQLPLWRGADRWVRRWRVPSLTEPGLTYVVAVDAEGRLGCSCPAWVHDPERRPCKHLKGFVAGGGLGG